jgi:hypothetical protein
MPHADVASVLQDRLRIYYKFLKACHQSCLNHLLDRAKKLIEGASARAARFQLRVQEVLQHAPS